MWLNEDIFIPGPISYIIWVLGSGCLFTLNLILRRLFNLPKIKGELKVSFAFAWIAFAICAVGLIVSIPLAMFVSNILNLQFMPVMSFCFFLPGFGLILYGAIREKRGKFEEKNKY